MQKGLNTFQPHKIKINVFNVEHKDFVLYLCNQPVNLVEHEPYLGNDIVSDIFDRSISHTVHTFYQKSNHVISDFRMLDFLCINCIQHIV